MQLEISTNQSAIQWINVKTAHHIRVRQQLKSKLSVGVLNLLDNASFREHHVHLIRLTVMTAPMTRDSDHWSDDRGHLTCERYNFAVDHTNPCPRQSLQSAWWSGREVPESLPFQAISWLQQVTYFSNLNNDRVRYSECTNIHANLLHYTLRSRFNWISKWSRNAKEDSSDVHGADCLWRSRWSGVYQYAAWRRCVTEERQVHNPDAFDRWDDDDVRDDPSTRLRQSSELRGRR